MILDVAEGQIQGVSSIVSPDKLRHLGPVADLGALCASGDSLFSPRLELDRDPVRPMREPVARLGLARGATNHAAETLARRLGPELGGGMKRACRDRPRRRPLWTSCESRCRR